MEPVTFRTVVTEMPRSGILPARWAVFHVCRECLDGVATDDLVAHAHEHRAAWS